MQASKRENNGYHVHNSLYLWKDKFKNRSTKDLLAHITTKALPDKTFSFRPPIPLVHDTSDL